VEPKFHFLDINTANLSGLGPHISIDNKIAIFKVSLPILLYCTGMLMFKPPD
jgi:hypothetical protein